MNDFWNDLTDIVPGNLIGAIILLVIGWIVARILASVTRRFLQKSQLDQRLARTLGRGGDGGQNTTAETGGKIVYLLVMLFVLISVFDLLEIPLVTQPLGDFLSSVFGYLPRIIGAIILAGLAWILATIVRTLAFQFLTGINIDRRFAALQGDRSSSSAGATSVAKTVSDVVFIVIILLFLPAILNALELNGILEPVQNLFNEIFAFIPNLIAAAFIIVIGWFVARIVRRLVTNLLEAVGLDRFGSRVGLDSALGDNRLSGTIGLLVYILILIPVLIAGLNALQLDAITDPASQMLNSILTFLPKVAAAAAILVISYIIGKVVADLVADLLSGTAYDALPERLGLRDLVAAGTDENAGAAPAAPSFSLARLTGQAILVAVLWFATIAALETLELYTVSALLTNLLELAGRILLGLVIFVVGLALSRIVRRVVESSTFGRYGAAGVSAQAAIIILFAAMSLRQMGVANDIINLAFGILLGAIGIAAAVAFGIGGRHAAGRQVDRWVGPDSSAGTGR